MADKGRQRRGSVGASFGVLQSFLLLPRVRRDRRTLHPWEHQKPPPCCQSGGVSHSKKCRDRAGPSPVLLRQARLVPTRCVPARRCCGATNAGGAHAEDSRSLTLVEPHGTDRRGRRPSRFVWPNAVVERTTFRRHSSILTQGRPDPAGSEDPALQRGPPAPRLAGTPPDLSRDSDTVRGSIAEKYSSSLTRSTRPRSNISRTSPSSCACPRSILTAPVRRGRNDGTPAVLPGR